MNPDRVIGGKCHGTVNGKRFEFMADVTIMPATVSREGASTSGGKVYTTEKAVPARAKITFGNFQSADPMDLYDAQDVFDFTVVESTRNIRHLFTSASPVGDPEKNLTNGEVTGIEIVTEKYLKTTF
jgi:hypothetical protein